jgi:hypothetical protein
MLELNTDMLYDQLITQHNVLPFVLGVSNICMKFGEAQPEFIATGVQRKKLLLHDSLEVLWASTALHCFRVGTHL